MERHQKEICTSDSGSLNFHGQSNLDFLRNVNDEATLIFGKKIFLPSPPVLRLMGKSILVLENYGNTIMAIKYNDKKNLSNCPHGSSQNHVNWFPRANYTSSLVMDRY